MAFLNSWLFVGNSYIFLYTKECVIAKNLLAAGDRDYDVNDQSAGEFVMEWFAIGALASLVIAMIVVTYQIYHH